MVRAIRWILCHSIKSGIRRDISISLIGTIIPCMLDSDSFVQCDLMGHTPNQTCQQFTIIASSVYNVSSFRIL